jgi:hypothetical protein
VLGANRDELGFYQERSLSVRLTKSLVFMIGLIFIWPPMAYLCALILISAFIFVFSIPVRQSGIGFGQDSIVVIAMLFAQLAVIFIVPRYFQRIFYGKPWFAELSKMPRSLVATVLRASNELSFELDDDNKRTMQNLADLNRDVMKWTMGRQYQLLHPLPEADTAASRVGIMRRLFGDKKVDTETRWDRVWRDQVLKSASGGCTVARAFEPDAYSWVTVPSRLTGIMIAVTGMTGFYEVTVLWLLLSRLQSGSSLLPVFQVAVGFSAATTIIIFLFHSYKLPEIPIASDHDLLRQYRWAMRPKARKEAEEYTNAIHREFGERLGSFQEKSISVISVSVKPRYFNLVRNYYARSLAYESVEASLIGYVLISIAIACAQIFGVNVGSGIGWLYARLAIALALMPVVIVGIHFLVFTLVAHFRKFVTLAVTGAMIAFIPPVASYLLAGQLPASPAAFASSAIIGIIGSAGADLALRSRKKIAE